LVSSHQTTWRNNPENHEFYKTTVSTFRLRMKIGTTGTAWLGRKAVFTPDQEQELAYQF